MKKVVALLCVVCLCALAFANTVFATGHAMNDLSFYIPEYYTEKDSEDLPGQRWITEDKTVTLRLYQEENPYYRGTVEDLENLYIESLFATPFIDSTDSYQNYEGAESACIEGSLSYEDFYVNFQTFVFPTENYVYIFEFFLEEDAYSSYVYEVIDSVCIYNSVSFFENDYAVGEDADAVFVLVVLLFPIAFLIFGLFFFKFMKKSADNDKSTEHKLQFPKLTETKFELNGKNINIFNEKFTVGSKEENFAMKELEKERKDREKMFN